mgnify:CR=1 FL=1
MPKWLPKKLKRGVLTKIDNCVDLVYMWNGWGQSVKDNSEERARGLIAGWIGNYGDRRTIFEADDDGIKLSGDTIIFMTWGFTYSHFRESLDEVNIDNRDYYINPATGGDWKELTSEENY